MRDDDVLKLAKRGVEAAEVFAKSLSRFVDLLERLEERFMEKLEEEEKRRKFDGKKIQ